VTDKILQWLLGVFFAAGCVSTFMFTLLPAVQKGHSALLGLPIFLCVALLTGVSLLSRQ